MTPPSPSSVHVKTTLVHISTIRFNYWTFLHKQSWTSSTIELFPFNGSHKHFAHFLGEFDWWNVIFLRTEGEGRGEWNMALSCGSLSTNSPFVIFFKSLWINLILMSKLVHENYTTKIKWMHLNQLLHRLGKLDVQRKVYGSSLPLRVLVIR